MNNVQLRGNLARDPKVSVTRTGKTLVRMTVACSETYKGKDGQAKEMTSFVPVTCWPPSSDLAQSLLKGDRVVVLGRFTTNSYERTEPSTITVKSRPAMSVRCRKPLKPPRPTSPLMTWGTPRKTKKSRSRRH